MTDFQISTLKEFYLTGETSGSERSGSEHATLPHPLPLPIAGLTFCLSPSLTDVNLIIKLLSRGGSQSSLLAAGIVSSECEVAHQENVAAEVWISLERRCRPKRGLDMLTGGSVTKARLLSPLRNVPSDRKST